MDEVKDEEWLKAGIVRALGWDAFVAEGVVRAVADAGSKQEVDEIVADYMGGDAQVKRLVAQFLSARKRDAPPPGLPPDVPAASSSTASASTTQATSGFARSGAQRLTDMRAPEGQEVDSPDVVDGLPVKRPNRASRRGATTGPPGSASQKPKPPKLERQVANCLACGKVYDCRGTLTPDVTAFIESGGVCTFCGFHVALSHRERSETRDMRGSSGSAAPSNAAGRAAAAAADNAEAAGASKGAPEAATPDAGEAAAVAFKDRLVEADRNSARRTTVVDDQADFFEIDGNAWLSDEERRALRERQKAIEEAEEARRRRVTVTVDLLGRQVLMADESDEAAEAAAGGCGDAAAAAAATAAEMPQGGGASAAAASATAAGVWRREDLRITRNPNLSVHPMFVRPPPKPTADETAEQGGSAGIGSSKSAGIPAAQAKQQQQQKLSGRNKPSVGGRDSGGSAEGHTQQRQRGMREAGRRRAAPPRLQHDDPFTSAAVVAPAD